MYPLLEKRCQSDGCSVLCRNLGPVGEGGFGTRIVAWVRWLMCNSPCQADLVRCRPNRGPGSQTAHSTGAVSPMPFPYCASTVTLKDLFPVAVITLALLLTVPTGVPISAMWWVLFFPFYEQSPLRPGLRPPAHFTQATKCPGIFIFAQSLPTWCWTFICDLYTVSVSTINLKLFHLVGEGVCFWSKVC